jgi:hypothetical protein
MKPIFTLSLVVFMILSLFSCKKVKQGVRTTVKGYVIDSAKNKRLANAKVMLLGCKILSVNGSRSCSDPLMDVTADQNGNFSMDFTAEGNYHSYDVAMVENEDYVRPRSIYSYQLVAGKENNITIKGIEMNVMEMHLKVSKTTANSMALFVNYKRLALPAKPIDTILRFKIVPEEFNDFYFFAYYPLDVSRGLRETLRLGKEPVVYYEKIVEDTDVLSRNVF